jgi:hypothetical protein
MPDVAQAHEAAVAEPHAMPQAALAPLGSPGRRRPVSHRGTDAARADSRIPRPDAVASLSYGLGNAALFRLLQSRAVQPKKPISEPGDQAEREADQVARKISRGGACGGTCVGCSNAFIQRARAPAGDSADIATVASGIGPGRALEPAQRRFFEQRLGVPLERTRIHTDDAAAQSATAVGAHAYTVGSDVVFAPGQYAPDTAAGRELLAHELAHVAQHGDQAAAGGALVHRQAAPGGTATQQGPTDAGPQVLRGQIYYYRGVVMSSDAGFMRGELRRLVSKVGLLGAEGWYQAMVRDRGIPQEESQRTALGITAHTIGGRPGVRSPIDVQRETRLAQEDKRLAVTAVPVVIQVYFEVREEAVKFLATFQEALRQTLVSTLRESEKRIQAERIRYGITKTGEWGTTEYKAENTVAFQGMVGAAKDLLAIRRHINALETQRQQLTGSRGKGGTFVRAENQPRYDQISAEMAKLEEQYAQELAGASLRYPALGAVLDESGVRSGEERLEALASGKLSSKVGSQRMGWRGHVGAGAVGEVLDSRQRAIEKVRDEVTDDPDRLWKLDSILALTKMRLGTSRLTMADKLIADKIEQIKSDESWLAIALGVITFALALIAAIPTAGASLALTAVATTAAVGTVVVSGYQLVRDIKEYQLQMALTNTDLNRRAYAISTEEPSMFWVALDLVFFVSDGMAAFKAFQALKNNARLALLAREGTEAAEAAARLEEAAKGVQGAKPGLGRKLLDSLAELRKRPQGTRAPPHCGCQGRRGHRGGVQAGGDNRERRRARGQGHPLRPPSDLHRLCVAAGALRAGTGRQRQPAASAGTGRDRRKAGRHGTGRRDQG